MEEEPGWHLGYLILPTLRQDCRRSGRGEVTWASALFPIRGSIAALTPPILASTISQRDHRSRKGGAQRGAACGLQYSNASIASRRHPTATYPSVFRAEHGERWATGELRRHPVVATSSFWGAARVRADRNGMWLIRFTSAPHWPPHRDSLGLRHFASRDRGHRDDALDRRLACVACDGASARRAIRASRTTTGRSISASGADATLSSTLICLFAFERRMSISSGRN